MKRLLPLLMLFACWWQNTDGKIFTGTSSRYRVWADAEAHVKCAKSNLDCTFMKCEFYPKGWWEE